MKTFPRSLSQASPHPQPLSHPPHSPLRGGMTKDVSLLFHGRGELESLRKF